MTNKQVQFLSLKQKGGLQSLQKITRDQASHLERRLVDLKGELYKGCIVFDNSDLWIPYAKANMHGF